MTMFVAAQTGEGYTKHQSNSPTKGYYSIGNNAAKLSAGQLISIEDVDSKPQKKGYYAIPQNSKNQKSTLIVQSDTPKRIPLIRKGYYSIGRNAEKL